MKPIRLYEVKDTIYGTEIIYRLTYESAKEEAEEMEKCFSEIERVLKKEEQIRYRWTGHCMIYQDDKKRRYYNAAFIYTDLRIIICLMMSGLTKWVAVDMSEFLEYKNFDDDGFILAELAIDFKWHSIYFLYDRSDPERTVWNLCKELNALSKKP